MHSLCCHACTVRAWRCVPSHVDNSTLHYNILLSSISTLKNILFKFWVTEQASLLLLMTRAWLSLSLRLLIITWHDCMYMCLYSAKIHNVRVLHNRDSWRFIEWNVERGTWNVEPPMPYVDVLLCLSYRHMSIHYAHSQLYNDNRSLRIRLSSNR